jgi:hypothetical protein
VLEPTARPLAVANLKQLGLLLATDIKRMRTTFGEPTSDDRSIQRRNSSGDFIEPLSMSAPAISQSWHRFEKALRVGMKGFAKYVGRATIFNDLASVHDHYPRSHLGHDTQIMCNQQDRHIQF